MTFTDRFDRQVTYLRVSVTDRCNFRCVYCMPEEGIEFTHRSRLLTFEELARIVRVFAEQGVRRVRLTGGEPTLRTDLELLVRAIAETDGIEEVAMTTNAFLLPRKAEPLREAGLSSLNISLDSLRPERFRELTRVGTLERVERGIEAARKAGYPSIKLNAVVMRGFNDDEIVELAEWAIARDLVMRFIEFMPIGGDAVRWGQYGCVPAEEMRAVISSRYQLEPAPGVKKGAGPARYWRATGPSTDGALIGFISAVTNCFCEDCNRVRITPEGKLRACLADDAEVDLRAVLRGGGSDEELRAAIREALAGKRLTHRFEEGMGGATDRVMTTIGG